MQNFLIDLTSSFCEVLRVIIAVVNLGDRCCEVETIHAVPAKVFSLPENLIFHQAQPEVYFVGDSAESGLETAEKHTYYCILVGFVVVVVVVVVVVGAVTTSPSHVGDSVGAAAALQLKCFCSCHE